MNKPQVRAGGVSLDAEIVFRQRYIVAVEQRAGPRLGAASALRKGPSALCRNVFARAATQRYGRAQARPSCALLGSLPHGIGALTAAAAPFETGGAYPRSAGRTRAIQSAYTPL